jgi:uncharacterized membrane protein (DUF485 family)
MAQIVYFPQLLLAVEAEAEVSMGLILILPVLVETAVLAAAVVLKAP